MYLGDDPLICGIDMARGGDDNCMIQFRRGKDAKSEKAYKIPGEKSRDSMKVVSLLILVLDRHKPDVVFMDQGSMGGPVADRMPSTLSTLRVAQQRWGHTVDSGCSMEARYQTIRSLILS